MSTPYEQLRKAQQDALDKKNEPTPDGDAARANAQERVRPSAGPTSARMDEQNAWANQYNKAVQQHAADKHQVQQQPENDPSPSTDTPQDKPSEQDKIDAPKNLTSEHEAARGSQERPLEPSVETPGQGDQDKEEGLDRFRRIETTAERDNDRDKADNGGAKEQDQDISRFRRDFDDPSPGKTL